MSDTEPEAHTCPRRVEAYGRSAGRTGEDRWEYGHGLVGQAGIGASCSYCGSLHPDRFMDMVERGWWVDPTDKSYKAYLAEPLSAEQIDEEKKAWLAGGFPAAVRDAVADVAEAQEAIEQEWQQIAAARGHGQQAAKFYFQHLSVAQQNRFIELANTKIMKIGIPGYFYVLPYFTCLREPEAG